MGRVEKLVNDYFGDEVAADRWLHSPCAALGNKLPIEHARTQGGTQDVERLINQLAHGITPTPHNSVGNTASFATGKGHAEFRERLQAIFSDHYDDIKIPPTKWKRFSTPIKDWFFRVFRP